ncbi:MAG TPA: hypothetical protein VMK65_09590 [Longimicrobiales bacterium]|nr:hypothetical protein [Longimicrobiales bacterium]
MGHHALRHPVGPLLLALTVGGCGGGHRLAEYAFAERTLAVVYSRVPRPDLRTGPLHAGEGQDAVLAVLNAGAQMAKEVEARRAHARLDSAAVRVDVGTRMAERTLERASRYLGSRPVGDAAEADYLLELDVARMGIDAGRGHAAYVFVDAEAILLDARTGHEIWSEDVRAWDRLGPGVAGDDEVASDLVTIGALGTASVADFERMLVRLADYAADRITAELRKELRATRRSGGR